jgi:hypothetical protein
MTYDGGAVTVPVFIYRIYGTVLVHVMIIYFINIKKSLWFRYRPVSVLDLHWLCADTDPDPAF